MDNIRRDMRRELLFDVCFSRTNSSSEKAEKPVFIWGIKSPESSINTTDDNNNDFAVFSHKNQYYIALAEILPCRTEEEKLDYFESMREKFKGFLLLEGYHEKELDNLKDDSFISPFATNTVRQLVNLEGKTLVGLYHKFCLFLIAHNAVVNACK